MKRHHGFLRLFLLTLAMACILAVGALAAQSGIITGDVVNARKGPGTGYEVVEMLAAGKQVTILGEENGWYHIQWNNSKGYVLKEYVAVSGSSSQQPNATVTGGSTINVRSGPGTDCDRVTMVAEGKRVAVLGQSGDWYYVSFGDTTGYIFKDFLTRDGSSSASSASTSSAQTVDKSVGNATVQGGNTINVRSGPGTDFSRVTMVAQGKRVTALAKSGTWFKVSFGGTTGYILNDYLALDSGVLASLPEEAAAPAAVPAPAETPVPVEPTASLEQSTEDTLIPAATAEATSVETAPTDPTVIMNAESVAGYVTGGTINVRSGPGTEYERVTTVSTGKKITILGTADGWSLVSFGGTTGYILGDYVAEGEPPVSSVGEQVAAMAAQYLGVHYVYGGSSPSGFDCSGLTMYLYKQFGYSLPHTASGQYANCGYKVSRSELQPGDLVFFSSPSSGGSINHVAIYIGNGQIIHARYSVGKVYTNSLSESYYSTYYAGAVRIA